VTTKKNADELGSCVYVGVVNLTSQRVFLRGLIQTPPNGVGSCVGGKKVD